MMTVAVEQDGRKRAARLAQPRGADLVAWYDRHRRRLPWRALPGETPDPYRVWLSEIMLQQTTVKAVGPYFARFTTRWRSVRALAAAVDGNVERVVARLFVVEEALPAAKAAIRGLAESLVPAERAGDFAQALMDLGATICTPKKPACALCPWMQNCAARRRGDPETFPVKAPKKEGRLRRGAAFVVLRAGGFALLRSRPTKGLLGGMTEVPTTDWTHDFDAATALAHAPSLSRVKPR